eukprot:TRINITY_DN572987_c0_g1_i1.p1 TRINITY_DN572987_c0_g1~~TRINITY_DN572987_c0_g1_i1.p1  ORF type:complete len:236 (-),score=63.43 TRINITY_DN572987_c0_g1_i1:97-804(-)
MPECPVCTRELTTDLEIWAPSCHHSFCHKCIFTYFDSGKHECPKCRREIKNREDILHNTDMEDILRELSGASSFRIFCKLLGTAIPVDISSHTTVLDLKKEVAEKSESLASGIRLCFGGTELSDDEIVCERCIQRGEVVSATLLSHKRHNVKPTPGSYQIFLKKLEGGTQVLNVNGKLTTAELKKIAEHITGIPVEEQRLLGGGKQLVDDVTLEDAGINALTTVHLVLRLKGGKW